MFKFIYTGATDCLMLKDREGNLVDYKFYNQESIKSLSVSDWLQMVRIDMQDIANKHNLDNYIYNLLEEN